MLNEYLFIYSESDGSFPVCFRVIIDGEDPDVPDSHELTGTVNKSGVEKLKAELSQKYPAPEFRVATSWANTWKAVEHNYGGLDYEYD